MIVVLLPEMILRKPPHMCVDAILIAMVAAGILPTQAFGAVL